MDVTMPDGTVIQGVPDGVTKQQLSAKYQQHLSGQSAPALKEGQYTVTDNSGNPRTVDPMSMMDLLKATVMGGTRMVNLAGKGVVDSAARSVLSPADLISYGLNKSDWTAPSKALGDRYQEASDAMIPAPTNRVEQAANLAGSFVTGKAAPVAGPAAAAPAGRAAEALAAAREQGYVVPPSVMRGTAGNPAPGIIEQLAGHRQLLGEATRQNIPKVATNIAEQFGLPAGTEITHDTMDAVRAQAGTAYEAISSLSPAYADLVQVIKGLRSKASGLYRQASQNYNAAIVKEGDEAWEKAQQADGVLAGSLRKQGGGDLVDNYLEARKVIAQTHDVDKAIVESRGEVNPQTFASLFAREKPLSGALETAGRSAQAFKPAFTSKGSSLFSMPDAAIVGSGAGLTYALAHDPKIALAALAGGGLRYGARKALLSGPVQDYMLMSPEQKRAALAEALLRGTITSAGQQE